MPFWVKNLPAMQKMPKRSRFDPWFGKFPWRRRWQPTPVFLPGEFHGQRSLVTYSLRGCKESDTTEQLSAHKPSGVMKSLQAQPVWPRRWIIPWSSLCCLLITSGTVGLSDQLSGYLSAAVSVTLTSLNNGPKAREWWCWQFRYAKQKS